MWRSKFSGEDLQGIWKLEDSFVSDDKSKKFKKSGLFKNGYFEFRGSQFCAGDLSQGGEPLFCAEPFDFVINNDSLVIKAFAGVIWSVDINGEKMELIGSKPDGSKIKFVCRKLSGGKKKKLSLRKFFLILILCWFAGSMVSILMAYISGISGSGVFYVAVQNANIRSCPSVSCEIIDNFPLNSKLETSYNSLSEMPDWIEIKFLDNGGNEKSGFISKELLSDELAQ